MDELERLLKELKAIILKDRSEMVRLEDTASSLLVHVGDIPSLHSFGGGLYPATLSFIATQIPCFRIYADLEERISVNIDRSLDLLFNKTGILPWPPPHYDPDADLILALPQLEQKLQAAELELLQSELVSLKTERKDTESQSTEIDYTQKHLKIFARLEIEKLKKAIDRYKAPDRKARDRWGKAFFEPTQEENAPHFDAAQEFLEQQSKSDSKTSKLAYIERAIAFYKGNHENIRFQIGVYPYQRVSNTAEIAELYVSESDLIAFLILNPQLCAAPEKLPKTWMNNFQTRTYLKLATQRGLEHLVLRAKDLMPAHRFVAGRGMQTASIDFLKQFGLTQVLFSLTGVSKYQDYFPKLFGMRKKRDKPAQEEKCLEDFYFCKHNSRKIARELITKRMNKNGYYGISIVKTAKAVREYVESVPEPQDDQDEFYYMYGYCFSDEVSRPQQEKQIQKWISSLWSELELR